MKKVVVVSSSLRAQSTSRRLVIEVMRGLQEHNEVQLVDLNGFNLQFCKGCLACQKLGRCVINDDVNGAMEVVKSADVLVFATPIYYYSVSGQLKTFLDRMNALYVAKDRKFTEVYALFTCADDAPSAIEGPKKAIEGWVECFDGVKLAGTFGGLALDSVNDLTQEVLHNAYEFGKAIR